MWKIEQVKVQPFENFDRKGKISATTNLLLNDKKLWPGVTTPNQLLVIEHFFSISLGFTGLANDMEVKVPIEIFPPQKKKEVDPTNPTNAGVNP